jgi:FKBP-type peptidyl-prolyl cis-trans isomerase FkpA
MKKLFPAIAVSVLLVACGQPDSISGSEEPASVELSSDNERILYALGVVIAGNIDDLGLSEEEFAIAAAGMRDVVAGRTPRVEMDVYGPRIQAFADERMRAAAEVTLGPEKAASAAFADEIAAEPGAERLASSVVFVPITEGDGANPTAEDTVTVHYHGTLRDGSVFDSSVERGTPASFPLSGVIPCWTEGVQKIRVGGKARLLCPSDTAYGDAGRPGIPGGAALLFEVELLSID